MRKLQHALAVEAHWNSVNTRSVQVATWPTRKTLPAICLNSRHGAVAVAHGSTLTPVTFSSSGQPRMSPVPGPSLGKTRLDDITSLAACENGDTVIACVSGLIQRCAYTSQHGSSSFKSVARYSHPKATVQAIDVSGNMLATAARKSVSNTGLVSLYSLASPWVDPFTLTIQARPWSIKLSPTASSSKWLAVGHNGKHALSLRQLDGTAIRRETVNLGGNSSPTACYGLCTKITNPSLLIAGFYDATVRLYDLRSRQSGDEGLLPTQTFSESWSEDAVYSVASGGCASLS